MKNMVRTTKLSKADGTLGSLGFSSFVKSFGIAI